MLWKALSGRRHAVEAKKRGGILPSWMRSIIDKAGVEELQRSCRFPMFSYDVLSKIKDLGGFARPFTAC